MNKYPTIRITFIFLTIVLIILFRAVNVLLAENLALLALCCVATFGMSHGSLDWMLAQHWRIRKNIQQSLLFLLGYSGVVGVSILIWSLLPTLALSIFLLMSVLHFANDWKGELNGVTSIVLGLAVVSIPTIIFNAEVLRVLNLLTPESSAKLISKALQGVAYVSFGLTLIIALCQLKRSTLLTLEIISLLLAGLLLPPIIYFSLYFCMLHATKHWLRMKMIGLYQNVSEVLISVIWPTMICILVGIWILPQLSYGSLSNALIRTLFIGLAALTVPHWLLLEVYPFVIKNKEGVAT